MSAALESTCGLHDATFEEALAYLQRFEYAPKVMHVGLSTVYPHAHVLNPAARGDWISALRAGWARCLSYWAQHDFSPDHPLASGVAEYTLDLATIWCDWPLVCQLGSTMESWGRGGPELSLRVAMAHWALGDSAAALDRCRRVLLERPAHAGAADLFESIGRWRDFLGSIAALAPVVGSGWNLEPDRGYPDGGSLNYFLEAGDLRLELLGAHHANDFRWQYADPSIAELCCLPHFPDRQSWNAWLWSSYEIGDQLPFAIVHREWGFVGVVNLILHRDVGFFYYWLGKDFRGQGLGPEAGRMLLDHAEAAWGMRACYAKVFYRNTASRRGLRKLRFAATEVPLSCAPERRELVYRRGEPVPTEAAVRELRRLADDMGSSMSIPVPIGGRLHTRNRKVQPAADAPRYGGRPGA